MLTGDFTVRHFENFKSFNLRFSYFNCSLRFFLKYLRYFYATLAIFECFPLCLIDISVIYVVTNDSYALVSNFIIGYIQLNKGARKIFDKLGTACFRVKAVSPQIQT
jgi:hypothetical protein